MKRKIFMKHNLKWVFTFTLALILTFAIGNDMKVLADSSTTMSFDKTYSGTTSDGGTNKYYFELPKAGRVTINLTSTHWLGWELLDSDYNKIDNKGKTGTSILVYDLIPGKYEFDIMQDYNHNLANYTVSVHFVSANETYTYENNMYIDVASQAAIPFNKKITGQLAVNDNIDYYKLVVPATGKVNFSVISDENEVRLTVNNSKDEVLQTLYFSKGGNKASYTLKKGTYYLCFSKVYDNNDYTGVYNFTASYEMDGPTNVTAKPSSYKALKVTAKKSGDITGYNIRYRKGSGSWKTVSVQGNKNLSKTIAVTPGSYKVQVRSYYTTGGKNYYSAWSSSKSVSCTMKTPASVKVTNSSSKALKITAKKSETITGYNIRYKKGSGSWKTVTVKGNKNLNRKIKGLKKGSTYKVQVRTYCTISGKNYPSSWSTTKTVKIKK